MRIGRRCDVVELKPLEAKSGLDQDVLMEAFVSQMEMHHELVKGDTEGLLAPAPIAHYTGSRPAALMRRADCDFTQWLKKMRSEILWNRSERKKWCMMALKHCLRIARGVHFIHMNHNTAHCDVKTDNIFLYNGLAHLGDLPNGKGEYYYNDYKKMVSLLLEVIRPINMVIFHSTVYQLAVDFRRLIDRVKNVEVVRDMQRIFRGRMEKIVEELEELIAKHSD